MSWLRWLIDKLTRLYLWLTHGKVREKEDYTAEGIARTVYWYKDENSSRAGHCTPFNTITMNKGVLEKYSENFIDYVFLHETGHSSLDPFLKLVITPLLILSIITAFLSLLHPFLWSTLIYSITGSVTYTLLNFFISSIVIVFPAVLFFTIMSFIDEGYAEYFALSRIGKENYTACHLERKQKSEAGKLRNLISRFQYPPAWLVLKFYNWRNS